MKYDFYGERAIYDTPGTNLDPPDELQQQQVAEQPITDAELPDRPTAKEVALWLRKSPNAIYAWANKGLIPARKVGGSWLFDKAALLEWAKPQQEVSNGY